MRELMHTPTTVQRLDFGTLQRIAVFRALQLGDLLCLVPALRTLRKAAPHASITLIGLPWAKSFADRFDRYIDDFLLFPGFPGLPESAPQIDKLPDFFAQAQEKKFDLALQLHGSGALSNPLTVTMGAGRNAGYFIEGQYCPEPGTFLPWNEREHEVLRYLHLLHDLGVDCGDKKEVAALEFPLRETDYLGLSASLQASRQILPRAGTYVCLHPGARLASRRWPPQRFGRVAQALLKHGWPVVLTGSEDERAIVDAVLQAIPEHLHGKLLNLCGWTDLGALGALIAGARLVVCNDTGISHLAAALTTPSVIICSGADPHRWAPLDRQRHRLLYADVPCRPCAYAICPIGHPCAENVGVDAVLHQALQLGAESASCESVEGTNMA